MNEHLGQLNLQLDEAQTTLAKYDSEIVAARKAYEAQLKRESVASISGRVLLLLEDLQNSVYSNLLKQVEADLKYKLNQLMRKADFFDDVVIDNDFNVHILKKRTIEKKDLLAMANRNGISTLSSELGGTAVRQLFGSDEKVANSFVRDVIKNLPGDGIILPVEIDKDNMSSGEKQVFVMSLYWALMQQSENDLPFIIDTPFARIDSEHRANITEHLFMELSGQLFILSTNEELRGQHLTQMSSQISKVFMLEYGSDLRTTVREDEYFEV